MKQFPTILANLAFLAKSANKANPDFREPDFLASGRLGTCADPQIYHFGPFWAPPEASEGPRVPAQFIRIQAARLPRSQVLGNQDLLCLLILLKSLNLLKWSEIAS